MKKSTRPDDRTLREGFEANHRDYNLEVYTDLECLVLDIPTGSYKSEATQAAWKQWNPWLNRPRIIW